MHLRTFSRLVMFEQSLFGLPWVFATLLLAWICAPSASTIFQVNQWDCWCWIIFAFTAARTSGMTFNRLIDRHIDAANPRTAQRALPSGQITTRQVKVLAVVSLALFVLSCGMINSCCLALSPIVIFLLWSYSYTKRYTALCHFVLGAVHFFLPLFAWAAATGSLDWPPFLIGITLWASIASNDIIYALQDRLFDQEYGLYSIPARLGVRWSMWIVRALHVVVVSLLVALGVVLNLGPIYQTIIACVAMIYFYFHYLVGKGLMDRAFFNCNTTVAIAFFIAVIGALWQGSL